MRTRHLTRALLAAVLVAACRAGPTSMPTFSERPFGRTPDGTEVRLFTLDNGRGASMDVATYGGIVTRLVVPDRQGRRADVVLGFDSLGDYLRASPYFGAIVGRYANRIARARFTLDGRAWALAANDGVNALHGGVRGFDKVVWNAEPYRSASEAGVRLRYVSADGEEGYPGRLEATVTYALTDANEFRIEYLATTDRPTVINLTHHGYFNLAGHDAGDILGHELTILADRYTPVAAGLLPTGEERLVQGTPFDFRSPRAVGEGIGLDDSQLRVGGGYDHNFVLIGVPGELRFAALLRDPASGREMEVLTTEPGLQFYSGNFLDGSLAGKGGVRYLRNAGLCLETQHFPDSPNRPAFPSTELRPGDEYRSTTIYRFRVR